MSDGWFWDRLRKKTIQDNKLAEVDAKILKARQRLKALEKKQLEISSRIDQIESMPREIDYDMQLIMQQLCCLPGDRCRRAGSARLLIIRSSFFGAIAVP